MNRPRNGRPLAVHLYGAETHGMSRQRTLCQMFMEIGSEVPVMTNYEANVTCRLCLRRMHRKNRTDEIKETG